MSDIFSYFKGIESEIIEYRQELHKRAETGFELTETVKYIKNKLSEIGCIPIDIGNNGVYTLIGKSGDKCILLRADMDALPIKEESGLDIASVRNMHACGHDMHSAMLLGVAKYLMSVESRLNCSVKLLFQPAEEILMGAKNMIENGILDNPKVTNAFMLHVMTAVPLKSGTVVVSEGGISAPATKYFEVIINGKGCHGAMPNTGRDPIIAAANIITMLDTIRSRELSLYDNAVLSIGSIAAGNSHNVIPNSATLLGTFRAYDMKVMSLIEESIIRICDNTAKALKCNAEINFTRSAPCLNNDNALSPKAEKILKTALGEGMVTTSGELSKRLNTYSKSTGSEDFAYFTEKVPSLMIGIAAGNIEDGYVYPLHHPKVCLDESAIIFGATALAELATNI